MKRALQRIAEAKRTRATRLELGRCGLKELPKELFKLVWLEVLDLYGNIELVDLSPLMGLTNLQKLFVSSTQVSDLSPLVGLTNLQELDVSHSQISDLRPLAGFTNLQELHVSFTQVSDLSPLAGLTNLQVIIVKSTKVSNLIPLAGLTNLEELNLGGTNVSDLSPLVGLTNLKALHFWRTQVSNLSPLRGLANLQELRANNTQVSDLSPLVGLTNLLLLEVNNTQVSDLSPLAGLTILQQLDVEHTKVSDLSPLVGLTNLQKLDVSSTQVSDLNPLVGLTNLHDLRVSKTQVSDLSPIFELAYLSTLAISGQQIQSIKDLKSIASLPRLVRLEIHGFPALNNPLLLSQVYGDNILDKVKTYLDSLGGKSTMIYETKMILTGEGDVGKTSVRKKLIIGNDKFAAQKGKGMSTEGFEIECYEPNVSINGTIVRPIVNIWDLGGQDVQLPTHQFFMRHSSLYLFVFNSRLNDEQNRFDKWLYLIKKLSSDPRNPSAVCPIIGVMNQFDEQTKLGTSDYWLDEYRGQLKRFITVNCAQLNDIGIAELEQEIAAQLQQIEGFGKIEMNDKWIAVRKRLKEITSIRKMITYSEYQEICVQSEVHDKASQDTLLNMLDKLGSLLWYEDKVKHLSASENEKLRSVIFLDHQWSSKAVYQLLMDKNKLIDHEASLGFEELKQYWDNEYWVYHEQLILMMKRFGFCFESYDKEHFIFTPLLPTIRHKEADVFKEKLYQSGKKVLHLRLDYADDSREDVMPRALTARMIAIKHKDLYKCVDGKRLYWRHGVALYNARTQSIALIVEHVRKGEIDITVTGDKAREYLSELLAAYDDLHDSLGGLRPQVLIPCNCTTCKNSPNPHFFKKEIELEERLRNGKYDIECGKAPFEKVQIRPLISDVIDRSPREMSRDELDDSVVRRGWRSQEEWESGNIITNNYYGPVGNVAGKTESQIVETVEEAPAPVVIPAPVVVTPNVPFWETHLGKSLIKGGGLGIALAIGGMVASKTVGFQFVWEFASIGGLLFFLYSYHHDPKYRYSRAAFWILGTWLFIGQLLPNIQLWLNVESENFKGALNFVSDNNPLISVLVFALCGLLWWLDYKNNNSK